MEKADVGILFEHPEWHLPLFDALENNGISFAKIDLKKGAFDFDSLPLASLYYNLVSPSAYLRGNQRAIPYALSICRTLESMGREVINGSGSMALEFSKSAQLGLLKSLEIDHPQSVVFNDTETLEKLNGKLTWPMILKPEQGGSGARMYLLNSLTELKELLALKPELWNPDGLLLLQEKLNYDHSLGIIRLEYLDGKLLYAMRVVTNGVFNLCPSVTCNPESGGNGTCELEPVACKPEFFAYAEVPTAAVEAGRRIMAAAGHTIGSVEYLETSEGRRVFYDINSNSNLRASIGSQFGIEPFEEVSRYLRWKSGIQVRKSA